DRSDPDRPSIAVVAAPHRDGRARWRSTSFFVTELLVVNEGPDHSIVHAQALFSQLADQPTQGEVAFPAALQQPFPIVPDQLLRPIAANRVGRHAAGPAI